MPVEKLMNQLEAKQVVCDAGRRLLKEGLVARTWGNISARVDGNTFVITPSGRTYEELTTDDIVTVTIEDLAYDSHIKPSSEKGLHAEIYKLRPDVNAVVHTHQMNASTVAAAREDVPTVDKETEALIGPSVRVASYALPGTSKLAKATAACLEDRNAALMANHGAVCVGPDMDTAFTISTILERMCEQYIQSQYMMMAHDSSPFDMTRMHRYYLQQFGRGA
jgi:L-fuculose-phosphate aldolase